MTSHDKPVALALSRQALPTIDRSKYAPRPASRAAPTCSATARARPQVILIGTGSEVALCVGAYEALTEEGIRARVVSMPSWELFEQQDEAYRESVLPPSVSPPASPSSRRPMHRLGPLHRHRRRDHRHAHLRRLRPGCRAAEEVRLHARRGPRGGPRPGKRADQAQLEETPMNVVNRPGDLAPATRSSNSRPSARAPGSTSSSAASSARQLQELIDRDGLKGITSNPAIFEKAMGHGTDYDEGFKKLAAKGDHRRAATSTSPGDRGHPRRRRHDAPRLRGDRQGRRLRQPRSLALPRAAHRRDGRRGAAAVEMGRPREPDGQGARHRRPACPRSAR